MPVPTGPVFTVDRIWPNVAAFEMSALRYSGTQKNLVRAGSPNSSCPLSVLHVLRVLHVCVIDNLVPLEPRISLQRGTIGCWPQHGRARRCNPSYIWTTFCRGRLFFHQHPCAIGGCILRDDQTNYETAKTGPAELPSICHRQLGSGPRFACLNENSVFDNARLSMFPVVSRMRTNC